MRTITQSIYTFNELSDTAKAKVLDKYRYILIDEDWYTHVIEQCTAELAEFGLYSVDVKFSGFHSQGDGASFEAQVGNYAALLAFDLDTAASSDITVTCSRVNHMYVHESSVNFNVECYNENYSEVAEKLSEELNKLHKRYARKIHAMLLEEYDYLTSDEVIAELLINEEYEFCMMGNL